MINLLAHYYLIKNGSFVYPIVFVIYIFCKLINSYSKTRIICDKIRENVSPEQFKTFFDAELKQVRFPYSQTLLCIFMHAVHILHIRFYTESGSNMYFKTWNCISVVCVFPYCFTILNENFTQCIRSAESKQYSSAYVNQYLMKVDELNNDVCSICFGDKQDAVMLSCRHQFCKECVRAWFLKRLAENEKINCPLCRKKSYQLCYYNLLKIRL